MTGRAPRSRTNALWGIWHEGVRQTAIDDGTNELIGIQHARVDNDRHGFHIADLLNKRAQVLVGHLGRDERIA